MPEADDTAPQPPHRPDGEPAPAPPAPAPADLRERVLRQRRHIEELTGEDPLRGGVDD